MNTERKNMSIPEPPPKGGDEIVGYEVINDIKERMDFGMLKYGTHLKTNNGRSALIDLYQELLDAVIYCKQELIERSQNE